MLIDFTVANYQSIKEAQTFSFVSESRTEDKNTLFNLENNTIKLYPFSIIYGPNASGKSKFISALDDLCDFVQESYKYEEGADIPAYKPFLLDKEYINKPIHFEIEYEIDNNRYLYILALLIVIGFIVELANIFFQRPLQTHVMQTFRLWTWFFYYILGGYIAQFNVDNLKYRFKNWMKIVSMLLVLISPIILFFLAKNTYHNLFAEYFYDILFVKFTSLGIFLMVLTLSLNENGSKWIVSLSNQTMGVFVIHTYVMKIWEKLIAFSFTGAYLWFAIFTLSISFIVIGILMRIPYLNRIVKL